MAQDLEIYATLGPSCHKVEDLKAMLEMGMNGIRLNLSHSTLMDHQDWIDNLHQACLETDKDCHLVVDLQGREKRLGGFQSFEVMAGQEIKVPQMLPIPLEICTFLNKGEKIGIGDQDLELQLIDIPKKDVFIFQALERGKLESHKSIHLRKNISQIPVYSFQDLENLKVAKKAKVDGLLVPFVQSGEDLRLLRQALKEILPNCRLMAKIENLVGVKQIDSIIEQADMIVIARGDLASSCGITILPAIQEYLEEKCRQHHMPYMVVTQMLESMRHEPVATRAEVNDVYQAVKNGASAIMLTGETASSKYPLKAMQCFCEVAQIAHQVQNNPHLVESLLDKKDLDIFFLN